MKIPGQSIVDSGSDDRMLIIMAKAPKPGMVKTRLTRCLPPPAVTALYRCLLEDTLTLARSLRGVEIAVMCPRPDVDELSCFASDGIEIVGQKGEGLAAALTSVFRHFARTGRRRVVAFNSDSPHLPASVLDGAFEALAAHDLVVGPTQDGGYYLVGAKADHSTLFDGDGLGTRSALEGLLARARGLELSIALTEPFYDIDVEDDLFRLAEELRVAPSRARRTAGWLKEWGQVVAQSRTGARAL